MTAESVHGLKALVTGASGFLGGNLCARLLDDGAEVFATSRSSQIGEHPNLQWRQCDLSETSAAQCVFREIRPDVVFHLAGQVTAAPDRQLVLPTFQSLLASTVNVLSAATELSCRRVVLTGSLTEPASNGGEVVPSSPYAAAKWASTAYARMFHKLYGTPVVIVRPFMTYGPGQNRAKIVPYVIASLLNGEAPKLASGRWEADWVYVDDVIDGFVRAACRPGLDGGDFDLGSGTLTSTRAVVEKLVGLIQPRVEPLFGSLPDRPAEQVRPAKSAVVRERLGWSPRTSLDEGLAATVRWHRLQSAPKLLGSAS